MPPLSRSLQIVLTESLNLAEMSLMSSKTGEGIVDSLLIRCILMASVFRRTHVQHCQVALLLTNSFLLRDGLAFYASDCMLS